MLKKFCVYFVLPLILSTCFLIYRLRHTPSVVLNQYSSEIRIERDSYGIPHIYADNLEAALYGMGYASGQDRLFQIDLTRRMATGRLSELIGNKTLEMDLFIYNSKLSLQLEKDMKNMPPSTLRHLQAFADGINAAAKDQWTPLEYYFIWQTWSPFQAKDSQAIRNVLALAYANSWANDALKYSLRKVIGKFTDLILATDFKLTNPLTFIVSNDELPDDIRGKQDDPVLLNEVNYDVNFTDLFNFDGFGSNGFVISGNHTKSGKPMLENDPHLVTGLPCLWYLQHVHIPGLDFSGVSKVGDFAIVSGRNNHISWGFTSLRNDNIDIYLEKTKGNQYLFNGTLLNFTEFQGAVPLKNGGSLVYTFKETIHGPVILENSTGYIRYAPLAPRFDSGEVISFSWSLLKNVDDSSTAWLKVLQSKTVDEARNVFNETSSGMAMLFASVSGDIAFQTVGRVPIKNFIGDYVLPGWLPEYSWQGYIPFNELPYVKNPAKGYILMANGYVASNEYKYFNEFGRYYTQSRVSRLTQLIEQAINSNEKIDGLTITKMLHDELWLIAEPSLAIWLEMLPESEKATKEYKILKDWNFVMDRDSVAASLFAVWSQRIAKNLMVGKIPDEILAKYLNTQLVQDMLPRFFAKDYPSIEPVCDLQRTGDKVESCQELVTESFKDAREFVAMRQWGDIHYMTIKHEVYSNVPVLKWLLPSILRAGGSSYTVHAQFYMWGSGFECLFGPNMKFITDLGNSTHNYWSLEGGMSENIFSAHFYDMLADFHYGILPIWEFKEFK